MNSQVDKTLEILLDVYKQGEKISLNLDSSTSDQRCIAIQEAMEWISYTTVCFENLFYNSKYSEGLKEKIQPNDFSNDIYNTETIKSMLGYIKGIRKMLKYGYLKDQFSGINNEKSQVCFVAMSFDPACEDIYTIGIKPAVETLGYEAIRVDTKPHNEKIDSKVIELILNARFVVADFTGQRNGVYYEAGFAKGIGLPVIQTCMNSDFNNMHFDIKSINTIHYDTPSKLKPELTKQIAETIGTYKPPINDVDASEVLF